MPYKQLWVSAEAAQAMRRVKVELETRYGQRYTTSEALWFLMGLWDKVRDST